MKTCPKCGTSKPLEEFYRRKDSKDGRTKKCGLCLAEEKKLWTRANKEVAYAKQKARRLRNIDKYKTRERAYRQSRKEHYAALRKAWIATQPDYHQKNAAKYRPKIREQARKNTRELTDGYINLVLTNGKTNLRAEDITPELRELKRIHIKLKRELKNENNR